MRFDPNATAPHWRQFVSQVFGGREPLIQFVQEFVGYCLTGATSEAVMLILHGQGSNGKSILLDVLAHVFGPYAAEAAPTAFVATRNVDAARNDLAALRGTRFVTATETSEICRLDMSVIKRVTGGDAITARFLHQELFSYRPQFKLLMATNHEPEVTSADSGTWPRLLELPFLVRFGKPGSPPAANKDHLTAEPKEERPGILNWAVERILRWQQDGLSRPADVVAATEEYEEGQDVLADFMAECVEEFAAFMRLAWQCQKRFMAGELPDPDVAEQTPHVEEVEARLRAGTEYLKALVSRLGLEDRGQPRLPGSLSMVNRAPGSRAR